MDADTPAPHSSEERPGTAAVDARGWVYVLDLVAAEVQVYQPKGAV